MISLPFKKKKVDADDEKKELDSTEPVKKIRRKKKPEPEKPWGKVERFIVFIFLIGLPLIAIIFLFHSKNSKDAKQVTIPAPKIINNIIRTPAPNTTELKNQILSETQNLTGTYGVWVQSLDNSYSLGVNENDSFNGASLFKLPLMIAYYQKVDSGQIDPETTYTLKFSDSESGAGILAEMPAGTVITYRDMVNAMGKNSDNTAFSIMENILGVGSVTNTIKSLGLTHTDFNNSLITPYDTSVIFYKLGVGNLISNNSKKELFASLVNTDFENLIPAGVPDNVQVIHKYGSIDNELNDAGLVYGDNPYILVILSKDTDLDEANVEIPKISQIVYNWANGVK